ncbi:hypothetical protein CHS0354_012074 [Potamilus streckersoni]|uniref:Uncharacterized protein n=1 Tax=Potamilus streckersoni TaxID=2493646 RepID=A0AAE0VRK9_9BIVA|nr:hypothetical protein CHS0354_012074 [Potamilus streckersoni]
MGSFCAKNRVDPTKPDYDTEHSSNTITPQPCLKCHKETTNMQKLPFNKSIPICESCLTKKDCQKCHKGSDKLLRSPCRQECCICSACLTKHMVKSKAATDIYFCCPICNQKMDLPREGLPLADRVMLIYRQNAVASDIIVTDMYKFNATYANKKKAVFGAASLPNNDIVVMSQLNDKDRYEVILFDSSLNKISEISFSNRPYNEVSAWGLCHLEDRKIAVSIPKQNLIHILTMCEPIRVEQEITTRLQYYCLANLNANELVATGFNDSTKKYYRCTIRTASTMTLCCLKNSESCCCAEVAKEDNVYELRPGKVNYIAVNNGKTRIYLSCEFSHAVNCCKIRGSKTLFTYKHDDLRSPRGVGVDSNDILYIVGYGSQNLHLVTPAGRPLKIIADHIPASPDVIVFNQAQNMFNLSAGWPRETSSFIRINTTDLLTK